MHESLLFSKCLPHIGIFNKSINNCTFVKLSPLNTLSFYRLNLDKYPQLKITQT